MSSGDGDQQINAFELGRLVQGVTGLQQLVSGIGGRLDRIETSLQNTATKSDLEAIRALAQGASDEAKRANNRLDAVGPWKQIAVSVLIALILAGLAALATVQRGGS